MYVYLFRRKLNSMCVLKSIEALSCFTLATCGVQVFLGKKKPSYQFDKLFKQEFMSIIV